MLMLGSIFVRKLSSKVTFFVGKLLSYYGELFPKRTRSVTSCFGILGNFSTLPLYY